MNKMKKLISFLFAGALALSLTACAFVATNDSNPDTGNSNVESNIGNSSDVGSNDSSDVGEHQHICAKTKEKAATCLAEGNIEYWTCLSCDKIFDSKTAETELTVEDVTIAKLAHKPKYVAETEASCNSTGNIEYWRCERCATYFSDEEATMEIVDKNSVIIGFTHPSLSHTEAVKPNGKENGNIEYWHCGDCDNYYKDASCTQKTTLEGTVVLSAYNFSDFVVEIPDDRDPVVLQLTDPQLIDSAQARSELSQSYKDHWATDRLDDLCFNYLTEIINAAKPDFIIITGDLIHGMYDDNGTSLLALINFMESFQIPWSPVFGNHDNESKKGADWQCEQLEKAEYCLFKQRELSGNGNYSVGIVQGDKLKRVFYMLDTNAVTAASEESLANGHTINNYCGAKPDQIEWCLEQMRLVKEYSSDVKMSLACHIQPKVFEEAYVAKYGFDMTNAKPNINIDLYEGKEEGDFGYIGKQLIGPWDHDKSMFNAMKGLGLDSIFVGHVHYNTASVVYEGVRLHYGVKSGEHDRVNAINTTTGEIVEADCVKEGYSPVIGGSIIVLSKTDGSLKDVYNYYCTDKAGVIKNGEIQWQLFTSKSVKTSAKRKEYAVWNKKYF